jgi:hypothetical protein
MGTLKGLITPPHRQGEPNFHLVLPGAMRRLVEEGLFVANPDAEGGYRITPAGLLRLRDLEKKKL